MLGPNGAGKTTTIRMLCCLISKTSGEAQIGGYSTGNGADSLAIRKLIGLVPDNIGLYEELTAYENLDYYGKLYECPEAQRKEKIEYYLRMMDLWEKRASYSLVGEKVQKSLEPLLATPTTDEEILAGKSIAAFIPAIGANFIGALIFMALIDLFTNKTLGYLYFPNWDIAIILFLLAPLACIFSVGYNVLVSSRVNDGRTAQQLGTLILLPFGAVYFLSEFKVFSLTTGNMLIMAAVLAVIDAVVFYLVTEVFWHIGG